MKKVKKKQPVVVTVTFADGRRLDSNAEAALIIDDAGRLWRISYNYSGTAELIKFPVVRA
jgi:hypothetical protein